MIVTLIFTSQDFIVFVPLWYTACSRNIMCIFYLLGEVCPFLSILHVNISWMYIMYALKVSVCANEINLSFLQFIKCLNIIGFDRKSLTGTTLECYVMFWTNPRSNPPRKTSVLPLTSNLRKHPSKTNKTCRTLLTKLGRTHKGRSSMDSCENSDSLN